MVVPAAFTRRNPVAEGIPGDITGHAAATATERLYASPNQGALLGSDAALDFTMSVRISVISSASRPPSFQNSDPNTVTETCGE
jgi:hypothetical protein